MLVSFSPISAQAPPSLPAIESRVDGLLGKLTLQQKLELLGGVDGFYIRNLDAIGLPRLKMADGPFGVRNYGPATTVAGGIALAASWDERLAEDVGETIGRDARARGVHFLLGPAVNIYRSPLCGRNFEYFGEDPYLGSRIAVGYIRGVQSQGVSATIKHFLANNSEYDRHNTDSVVDERTLREIYLPIFEAAVKEAKVGAVMDSYNLTNGLHMTQNHAFNDDLLKKEWGFDGIVMSDWFATYDGVAAALNGLDLEMPSARFMNPATLLPAIRSGKIPETVVDDKVRRILRTAVRFGWLDREQMDLAIPVLNNEGKKVALESALGSMVLLKNDGGILPLDKRKIKTIAVIGPDAYPAQPVGGGSAAVRPFHAVSFLEGISQYLSGGATVLYHRGLPTMEEMARATEFTTEPSGGQQGLKEEVFDNTDLRGPPTRQGVREHIGFDEGAAGALNNISARWTGYYTPKAPADYTIFMEGPGESGGYRLFIDNKLVFDHWNTAPALLDQTKLALSASPHAIRLEYFIRRNWAGMGLKLGIVLPSTLVDPAAKKMAASADAVLVSAGFDPFSESESADRTFSLPVGQDELIRQIAGINRKTIVTITSGGGANMTSWSNRVPALLETWYSGQEGGTALAELLFGDVSPSGKLPVSFERSWSDNPVHDHYYPQGAGKDVVYKEGIFLGYRYYGGAPVKPLFPFGYGLSYTTFVYKNLRISPAEPAREDGARVAFDVTNTGTRAGAEVAEVYVGESHPKIPRPVKELKAFSKVYLQPGETKHIELSLDRRAFSYFDVTHHHWAVDPGDFTLYVGASSEDIRLTGHLKLQSTGR